MRTLAAGLVAARYGWDTVVAHTFAGWRAALAARGAPIPEQLSAVRG